MNKRIVLCGIITLVVITVAALAFCTWYFFRFAPKSPKKFNFSDPCDDFYTYACHQWMDQNRVPGKDEVKFSVFTKQQSLVQKRIHAIISSPAHINDTRSLVLAKQFFADCIDTKRMNTRGLSPLLELIQKLGGWPILSNTDNNISLTESITQLRGIAGWDKNIGFYMDRGLFYVKFNDDEFQGSVMTLYPSTTILRHMYLKAFSDEDPFENYRDYIYNLISELHRDKLSELETDDLYTNIDRMIRFEARLVYAARLENFENYHSEMFTVKDFQLFVNDNSESLKKQHRLINWTYLLNEISPNFNISGNDTIKVIFPAYFQELGSILGKTNLRLVTIKNFLIWSAISKLISETTDNMRDIYDTFNDNVEKSRNDFCSGLIVNDTAGPFFAWIFAVGYEYIQRFVRDQDIQTVTTIVDKILKAFVVKIRNSSWLDAYTKDKLENHLKNLNIEIAYPNWLKNLTELELYYANLNIRPNQYFENYLALMNFQAEPASSHSVNSSSIFLRVPFLSASPRHIGQANSLVIPAGILGPPYFDAKGHLSDTNFGAMGTVVGHEMSHAIYSHLKKFFKSNTPKIDEMWSEKSEAAVNQKMACINQQYTDLAKAENVVLTGTTLQEDVADNVGLDVTFLAYKQWKEIQQNSTVAASYKLFFLSFARIWCANYSPSVNNNNWSAVHNINSLRVIGTLSNSPDFALAWNCPKGSPMNPQEKCAVQN